jgi:hypothetical protein
MQQAHNFGVHSYVLTQRASLLSFHQLMIIWVTSQSRQSAKLILQPSELGLPQSLTQASMPPPLWFRGEGHC